ncbi:Afamin, partial [Varanus komodoensis]
LLILNAQELRKATYEEVKELAEKGVELAKKCTADESSDNQCSESLSLIFGHLMCHDNALIEKYGYTACCAKEGAEEEECFHALKNEAVIPVYQHPPAEEACKQYHDNKVEEKHHFEYEVARRNPSANVAAIHAAADRHEHALEECCKAEDKDACIHEKAPANKILLKRDIAAQQVACHILKHSKDEMHTLKLANLAQKFPKATAHDLEELAKDIVHAHEECCKGHEVECLLARGDMIAHVCDHQEKYSTKVHDCCEKPWLDRADCLINVENDEKPADLSATVPEFLDKSACQKHAENKQDHQDRLLTSYTKKAPQLEGEELLKYTKGFVGVANRCCNLDEGHKLKCAEENTGLVLGSICARHDDHNINKQVCKCCSGHYDDLRECFGGLGVDPEYHAPAFNADLFHLDEGICTDAPEEAQRKKQTLLINMIKTKPDITEEQLVSAIVDFQGLVTNCCEAENHKVCFDTELSQETKIKTIKQAYELTGEDFFDVLLILNAQQVQQASYEEIKKLADNGVELAKKCTTDESSDKQCSDSLSSTVGIPLEQNIAIQKVACHILKHSKAEMYAMKLANLAQKFPKAENSDLEILARDIVLSHDKCCNGHEVECLLAREEMLKKHVAENLEVVKKNCDAHSKLGDYFFQNGLLTVYTMKAPQLEAEELLMYTRGFVRVANKCCNLDEGHKLKCAEENMGLVLGSICLQHNDYNINKQVGKCCTGPYDDLRECFGGLGVDPEYHAPAFNADLFHLDEGICTDAPEEAQRKKQTLLINMIKTKPDISEEQLVSAIVDFQGLVTNCCEADNHKACFDTETLDVATYDEVEKMVHEIMELAKKCTPDELADPACRKPLVAPIKLQLTESSSLQEHICSIQKTFGKRMVTKLVLYEISRRYPEFSSQSLLRIDEVYEAALEKCCKLDNPTACLAQRTARVLGAICQRHEEHYINKQVGQCCSDSYALRQQCFTDLGVDQEYAPAPFDPDSYTFPAELCSSNPEDQERNNQMAQGSLHHSPPPSYPHNNDPVSVYALYSQILQKATLQDVTKLRDNIVALAEKCAADEQSDLACVKPLVPDISQQLQTTLAVQINRCGVLKTYGEPTVKALKIIKLAPKFLKADLATASKIGTDAAHTYAECCRGDTLQCFLDGEEQLEKLIADSKAVVTAACTRHSKLGNYAFQNMLLTRYTKKAPQLEFADLHEYTKQLTSIADKCCNQDDGYRLKCSEGNVDIVLGAICQQHAVYYINRQISRCCSGSYPFRRECFSGLGTDPDYFPVPFNPELFTFHEDLCLANPEEQQTMKQMFLVFLVKHKLSITDEQLLNVNVKFTGMVAKCCDANNHEECFSV